MIFGKEYFEKVFQRHFPWGRSTSEYEAVKYRRQIEAMKQNAPSPKRILEVGCAEGAFTIMVASAFPEAEILSVDISHRALERARRSCESYTNVRHIEGDIVELLKRDHLGDSFDIVVQSESLYYLFPNLVARLNLHGYLRDLTNVLTEDGILVAADGISGPTRFVIWVFHIVLREFCHPVSVAKYREWNEFRNNYITYKLGVFRRARTNHKGSP